MSPFCEICEKPFVTMDDHFATCIICGQECCKDCIDNNFRICNNCDTSHQNKPMGITIVPERGAPYSPAATVSQDKINANKSKLEIRLPDTRGVTLSRWGAGNLKIGMNVITYSKLALETCPGASVWCKGSCYAQRIAGVVAEMVYKVNTEAGADVPPFPSDTDSKLCRPHVSGDFDSVEYIGRWMQIVISRPDVQFWAYTRSWNVPELLPALECLRALPNIQLFASVDESMPLPPSGWRIAWIEGDYRIGRNISGTPIDPPVSLVCPEERKKVENCEQCGYCFKPAKRLRDVVFLKH